MAFLEEYTLLDELGQGGYATVYKVRHNELGYIRAIRVLNAIIAHGETDKTYQRFLDECRLLLRLGNGNHPNIVHIYQPLLKAQRAIVEMDFVDGKDLYHYLEEKHSFVEIKDVLRLLNDIGSALSYCHEDIYKFCMDKDEDNLQDDPEDGRKVLLDNKTKQRLINKYRVIHNDIHSGNIIRREDGSYVLLDFGLAIEGDSVVRSSRRKNGAPEFKAPEKWENDSILTTQSDIYSFGVVLYEYLAGRVPFLFDKKNSNPVEAEYLLGKAHKEQQPASIFELRKAAFEHSHPGEIYEKDYPDWLEMLIMKCLSKSPKDRFKNGKELYEFVISNSSDIDASQLQKLKDEIAELQGKIDSLEYNKDADKEIYDKLLTENSCLGQEVAELQKLRDQLQEQIVKLQSDKGDRPRRHGRIWMWASIVLCVIAGAMFLLWRDACRGFDDLQRNIEKGVYSHQNTPTDEDASDLWERIISQERIVDALRDSIAYYEKAQKYGSAELIQEISEREKQVIAKEKRYNNLEKENRELRLLLESNSPQSKLEEQIAERDSKISELEREINDLAKQYEVLRDEVNMYRRKLDVEEVPSLKTSRRVLAGSASSSTTYRK